MKMRFLFLLSISCFAFLDGQNSCPIRVRRIKQRPTEDYAGCKCYCSELCGLRDAKPEKGDKPFISSKYFSKHTGKGICFCKQRDEDLYPGKCQITKEDEDQITCCPQ